MILAWLTLFFYCFAGVSGQKEMLFMLRAQNGTVQDIVSSPPDKGYMTVLFDLGQYRQRFNKVHPSSAYDPNSNSFILANSDPPVIAVLDTFSKDFRVLEMPDYGSIISFVAYDGILYCLQGLNPDTPGLGHFTAINIASLNLVRNLFKFRIPTGSSFSVGAAMTYVPQGQYWIASLGTNFYRLSAYSPPKMLAWPLFTSLWNLHDLGHPGKMIGYKKGIFSWIDTDSQKVSPLHAFTCAGVATINTMAKKAYHVESCDGALVLLAVDFKNTTVVRTELDPALATAITAQSSGRYTPYGCGVSCGTHLDCGNFTSCNICRLGKCSASGECNAFCTEPKDCFAGVCANECDQGHCGRMGCGMVCNSHDQCKSHSTSCQICRDGKCTAEGTCNAFCQTGTDCYDEAKCRFNCVNWACSPIGL